MQPAARNAIAIRATGVATISLPLFPPRSKLALADGRGKKSTIPPLWKRGAGKDLLGYGGDCASAAQRSPRADQWRGGARTERWDIAATDIFAAVLRTSS